MSSTIGPVAVRPADAAAPPRCIGLLPVLTAGLLTELALLLGLAWPLRLWQPPDAITAPEPLSRMLGESSAGLVRFVLALVVWATCYVALLSISRRPFSGPARRALLLLPALFALTLAPTWPAASKDLYHYIMEGRTVAVYGGNPLTTPPAMLPPDPLAWILSSWQWEPSRYGPLWAQVAALPVRLAGDDLRGLVLAFKAIGVLSFLATALLLYLTVARLRPALALPAYVLVAWNPLLLFESAANAHNDSLMLALTALALYLTVRRAWAFAFPALAAAALVKYVPGLLGPLLLIWAWHGARSNAAERRRIVAGLCLGLLLVAVCYSLVWDGAGTFRALRDASGNALNSPGWLLREALERSVLSQERARLLVSAPLTALFLAVYALAVRHVWRTPHAGSTPWLAGFAVIAAYLVTISWWFWPWYIVWLLPLAGLLVGYRVATLAVIWSLAALAAYVPITFRPLFWGEPPDDRMPLAVTFVVFLPAALTALLLLRDRRGGPAPR